MSVLIKGLKMPRVGLSVVVDLWNDGKAYVYGTGNAEMYEAVELPDHGDLIDRDALTYPVGSYTPIVWTYEYGPVVRLVDIKHSPVVIPAERSEE